MRIENLGVISGDVVLFGGVHSNLEALQALQAVLKGRTAICTGDTVAYCADAETVATHMRESRIPTVAGNCEIQLAQNADGCGCGFEAETTCDLLSKHWYAHARSQLSPTSRDWMAGLPDVVVFEAHGRRSAVIHGGVSDVARFLWSSSCEDSFIHEINLLMDIIKENLPDCLDIRDVYCGHSGIPFIREFGKIHWCNAGAIGMPPNDGGSATRYVVITSDGARIEHLTYDWRAAQKAMRKTGLTQGYDTTLETGYWPSEDVLPAELRAAAKG